MYTYASSTHAQKAHRMHIYRWLSYKICLTIYKFVFITCSYLYLFSTKPVIFGWPSFISMSIIEPSMMEISIQLTVVKIQIIVVF